MFTELCISEDLTVKLHGYQQCLYSQQQMFVHLQKQQTFKRVHLTDDYVSWSESMPFTEQQEEQ